MAKVIVNKIKKERIILVDSKNVTLQLEPIEAVALYVLLGNVGGISSLRKATSAVWEGLYNIIYDDDVTLHKKLIKDFDNRVIEFNDVDSNFENCIRG